jgi:hypothetical protein
MDKKAKGKIAELMISAKLMEMGWKISNPLCENTRYDLLAEKNGKFVRVQVKYVTPSKGVLDVNCKSSNNWSILRYTTKDIDILAVYDAMSRNIYFIPASKLNISAIKLRIEPTKNQQQKLIRLAQDFEKLVV